MVELGHPLSTVRFYLIILQVNLIDTTNLKPLGVLGIYRHITKKLLNT